MRTMKRQEKKRVFTGLSGGVDSAVSAAILKKAGYEVTGVFIKVWQPDWIECSWKEDRREAMRVAAHLDIPFITLDLEKEYKQGVIDYMLAEYKAGRTPNPDVMCNREVKFGAFWRWAEEQGADYIATGHYARIHNPPPRFARHPLYKGDSRNRDSVSDSPFLKGVPRGSRGAGDYILSAGLDGNKDQSYFLWTLNQDDLDHILFPVGGLNKAEVRKLAKRFNLPNADRKDSQGLCFIGKVDVKEFLAHYIHAKPGDVLDESGEVIGTHPGALFFTIGERHGFSIRSKTQSDKAYYVIDKDIERNTITVGHKDLQNILPGSDRKVRLERVNWVSGQVPEYADAGRGFNLFARSRYRQPLQRARISAVSFSETTLEFEKPQDTLTPGQSLVIYDGDKCLGGGIIE